MRRIINKFLTSYREISLPAKASFWYVVCNILQKGISLFCTPIFTRLLTTEQYGTYSVYQSWYSIIAIIATLYLYSGVYNNGLVKFPDRKNEFTSSMMGLTICCTFILLIIYIINPEFWNDIFDLSTVLVVAMLVQALSTASYSFWAKQQRFTYNYKPLILTTLGMSLAAPLLGVATVLMTDAHKGEARVLSFTAVHAIVGTVIFVRIAVKGKKFINLEWWKYALGFSLPLVPHYLAQVVLSTSDRIMINNIVGKSEAGIYSVAYTISMMMQYVTQGVNDSLIPFTYQNLKKGEYKKIRSVSDGCLILVAAGCVCAMLIAPELLKIFASADYSEAVYIIPAVAASVYFMFLYTLYGNVEFYFEKTRFVMVSSCLAALLNVILNFIFIRIYGYMAAGYTTLISYILFSSLHATFYRYICRQILNIKGIYSDGLVAALSVFVIAAAFVVLLSYNYPIMRGIIAMVLIVIAVTKRQWISEQLRIILKGK